MPDTEKKNRQEEQQRQGGEGQSINADFMCLDAQTQQPRTRSLNLRPADMSGPSSANAAAAAAAAAAAPYAGLITSPTTQVLDAMDGFLLT